MSRYNIDVEITEDICKKVFENCSNNTSRVFPEPGLYRFAYGLDHAVGWFCEFYSKDFKGVDLEGIVSYDSMFTGFSGSELRFMLDLFEGKRDHIDMAYLDYGF